MIEKVAPNTRKNQFLKILSGEVESVYSKDDIIAGEMADSKWARQGAYKITFVKKPYGDEKLEAV